MLTIMVGAEEGFNEETQEFFEKPGGLAVTFEHSLVSVSKWESKYEKVFLSAGEKSEDEIVAYIQMMVISPEVSLEHSQLTQRNVDAINNYIASPQTATTFPENPSHRGRPKRTVPEIVTSELIYYWMVAHQIPFECENWHLNRLLTLIKVCNVKAGKPKKMSRAETAAQNREINARRRAELGTKG